MKTLIIIISVVIIIILILWFTPGGQKMIKKGKGEEVDTSTPIPNQSSDNIIAIKPNLPVLIVNTIPVISKGEQATPKQAEDMLISVIRNAYTQLTVMKIPYKGITDQFVKERALKTGRTYKEQLAKLVIKDISKNTFPFGNIDGTSISPAIMNKYIQSSRNSLRCRPGMNIDRMIATGKYKHFTSKSGSCKVNKYIKRI